MVGQEWKDEDYTKEELNKLPELEIWINNKADNTSDIISVLEEKEKLEQIQNIASILFNTKDWLTNACYYTKLPKQCSDASTLYTIIKINNKDVLIKVWAWEFNTEVFNQEDINKIEILTKPKDYLNIKWFAKTPIPLFVVNQVDSYFADDDKKLEMRNNPKQYLQDNSRIVVPEKKKAYIKKNDKDINFNNINMLQTDMAIKKLQTALFETKFNKKDMETVNALMKRWKEKNLADFTSTINYFQKHAKDGEIVDTLIYVLENMLAEKWDMYEMHELVQSYNTNKKQFE